MTDEPRPASLHLRMAPHLREALRDAARAAGCSLNAFAVQVLAAAAGDEFIGFLGIEIGSEARWALMRRIDAEDPEYYLEWHRARQTGCEPRAPRLTPAA
jgi:hypothetical protein